MQEVFESGFHIVLKSDKEEFLSEHWQAQCWQFYDSVCRSLPEGSIDPLTLGGSDGSKVDKIILFSTLVASGITVEVLAKIIFDAINTWLEHRPTAEINLVCPNGSTVKIEKQSLSGMSKFFEDNKHLSICEALELLSNSNK